MYSTSKYALTQLHAGELVDGGARGEERTGDHGRAEEVRTRARALCPLPRQIDPRGHQHHEGQSAELPHGRDWQQQRSTVRVAAASQPKPTVAALTDDEVRES